jgi:hypothetical protein
MSSRMSAFRRQSTQNRTLERALMGVRARVRPKARIAACPLGASAAKGCARSLWGGGEHAVGTRLTALLS